MTRTLARTASGGVSRISPASGPAGGVISPPRARPRTLPRRGALPARGLPTGGAPPLGGPRPPPQRAAGAAQNRDLELGVGIEFEEGVVDVFHELIVRRVELLRAVQDDVAHRPLPLVPHRLEFRRGAIASGHRSLLRCRAAEPI